MRNMNSKYELTIQLKVLCDANGTSSYQNQTDGESNQDCAISVTGNVFFTHTKRLYKKGDDHLEFNVMIEIPSKIRNEWMLLNKIIIVGDNCTLPIHLKKNAATFIFFEPVNKDVIYSFVTDDASEIF